MTTDVLGYSAAHLRVRKLFGKASEYECIDCGRQAEQWCYNNAAGERELMIGGMGRYSLNPVDYDPRCRLCHGLFDSAYRRKLEDQR